MLVPLMVKNQFYSGIFRLTIRQMNRTAWSIASKAINENLQIIQQEGTWKNERIITTAQGAHIQVNHDEKKIINFCANNYLGLSSHPEVIEAGLKALKEYGAGLSSVRFICGTQNIHKELEEKISKFHCRDDAILYASCFDANAGLFEAILTPDDAVISDQLNHASIIDGIRLCKAQKYRFSHRNMEELESILLKTHSTARIRMIVTDGVFSMDGNVAPLPEIVKLAEKYDSIIFVDECHATGFFGETGRGTAEYYGLAEESVQIINSTLGKALGGAAGGYTTGPKELIDLLRQKSRPYLFSNSIPPPIVAQAIKVFDLLTADTSLVKKVHENTRLFRESMNEYGFNILGDDHPICPVYVGEARLATLISDAIFDQYGIYVVGFSFPVVPKNKARIRVQMSAAHSTEDVKQLIDAFVNVGRQFKLIE
ncbi:glycine C-acetyltransferase/2-amino-3-ketobutyrate-CoA ligase-like [Euroglyphus maynei]|uniref:Glycine C-acetyltransferase/2-amino-3-ketobutyrate-CoA ligase-like n=1 Tax=Euroglyphus maynei TaxID=6958 RepID=A0A1Y3AXJ6_EURMA|nr:glycine C-acetyltransferase/2-amino-3-ketobutyrate-CoA ligase-like [Euroglyphus maynei]